MDSFTSLVDAGRGWFQRRALFFRIIGIGFFGLILLIPLSLVDSTLGERKRTSQAAIADITGTWGASQRLVGPMLVVPFTYKVETEEWAFVNGERVKDRVSREMVSEAIFLPEQLTVAGSLEPSVRQRGIYTAHVYSAALRVSGRFARPDFAFVEPGAQAIEPRWDRARVCLAVSDLRGARESLVLTWDGTDLPLQSGARLDGFATGVHVPVTLAAEGDDTIDFEVNLTLNGSGNFSIVPVGRETRMQLASPWPDPSFNGAYLPTGHEIGAAGFTAAWQVSYYGRNFPQQWTTQPDSSQPEPDAFAAAAFGVSLVPTVDAYRTVERSVKYGVLFLTLVFTTFFLFEATCALQLNALNYLLVGAALCLFFLALLALSEFVPFGLAYALAAAAATGLIGLYSWRVLRHGRRAWLVSAMLGGVYAYLFFVLRLEDFALLAGTVALFAALAAVMYATRNFGAEEAQRAEPIRPS